MVKHFTNLEFYAYNQQFFEKSREKRVYYIAPKTEIFPFFKIRKKSVKHFANLEFYKSYQKKCQIIISLNHAGLFI